MSNSQQNETSTSPLAILRFDKQENVDLVMTAAAEALKRDGYNVTGFLQREQDTGNSACCSDMYLEDISSGNRFQITQSLGAGSKGCRLDPVGLTEAVSHMSRQVDDQIDVLFLNRFGKGEEEGGGFRTVIESAFMLNIPTLIAVRDSYLQAWQQFSGDDYSTLQANPDIVLNWCRERLAKPTLLETV